MSVAEVLIEKINQLSLPEQERLLRYVEGLPKKQATLYDRFQDYVKEMDTLPTALPSDLSENHDHYLHGMPKRS